MGTPASWVATRPTLDHASTVESLRDGWAITGRLEDLPSERDRNILVVPTGGGARLVLKVANLAEDRALLACQIEALGRLAAAGVPVARVVPDRDGNPIRGLGRDGGPPWARLVTWLPGRALATVGSPSDALLCDLGTVMGRSAGALLDMPAGPAERPFQWDIRRATEVIAARLPDVAEGDRRARLERILDRLVDRLDPRLAGLRHSVIHNDANDHNVLVDDDARRVAGLLDLGDMVASVTAAEAAVAIAYAMFHRPDPLGVVRPIVAGFVAAFPLTDDELDALPELIVARLGMSVAIAARQTRLDPDPYLRISEASAWALLARLDTLAPDGLRAEVVAAAAAPTVAEAD